MKKSCISLTLSVLMVFSMFCTTAFAVDDTTSITVDQNDALALPECHISSGASTCGWGGTPAQVTKIELYDCGWLEESGNFGIILKVTGYGKDNRNAFFNGTSVSSKRIGSFINYGNTADGFYYLYDCGPITAAGIYTFKTTFTSTSSPNSKLSFTESFTFSTTTSG